MDRDLLVLITNDDGIAASGLLAAAEAVASFATPLIVAPATNQTGMGRSYPRCAGVGVIEEHHVVVAGQATIAYSVVGSPAETVAHAVLEIADRRPALCVAGINAGANVGLAIGVSGTIGAAVEADALGIPALAVSHELDVSADQYAPGDWMVAAEFVSRFARAIISVGLPPSTAVLNLNIPTDAQLTTPVRRTRQAQQNIFEPVPPLRDIRSETHRLAIRQHVDAARLRADDDARAVLVDRAISYTLLARSLTDHAPWPLDLQSHQS